MDDSEFFAKVKVMPKQLKADSARQVNLKRKAFNEEAIGIRKLQCHDIFHFLEEASVSRATRLRRKIDRDGMWLPAAIFK